MITIDGVTPEIIEARHAGGQSYRQIAQYYGVTLKQLNAFRRQK